MQPIKKAHLAALGANLCFGINFAAVKMVTPSLIGSFGLNVARVLAASGLFWLLYFMKPGRPGIEKKDIGLFILCAVSGIGLNQLLFIKGLSLTTTIHSSLLILITPILITFLAAWWMKEPLSWQKIIGLLLGIGGASLLILSKGAEAEAEQILLGDIFIILNAIVYSVYLIMVKPLMTRYSAIHVVRWTFTIGMFMILPVGWNQFQGALWDSFTPLQWAAFIFVLVGGTFFAYLLNVYAIGKIGASVTGSYIYTQPVFAAIIAILWLGESFTWVKLLAACLIFLGVFGVTRTRVSA
ncbi:MAG: DMT family transporter [Hydrotalea sp.]|jgi:drug/metabolite transporter (DMT)-like permease|nr:DMT family transporter [Hydrotalea sp.]